jgi:hypothetical protein
MTEPRVRLLLRIPASLKAKLAGLAEREHRSLNRQIEFLLDRSIRDKTKGEAGELPRPKAGRRQRM